MWLRFGFRIPRLARPAIDGFDLRDYNSNYDGPTVFISPLAIKWPDGALNR